MKLQRKIQEEKESYAQKLDLLYQDLNKAHSEISNLKDLNMQLESYN